jgi:hypothetical protein
VQVFVNVLIAGVQISTFSRNYVMSAADAAATTVANIESYGVSQLKADTTLAGVFS